VRRAVELGVHPLRHRRDLRFRGAASGSSGAAIGEDRGPRSSWRTKIFPVLPVAPVVEQRAVAQREPARRQPARPVPGAPAQPGGQGRPRSCAGMRALQRVGLVGRGRRQQLLAGTAGRAARGRPLGARVLSNQCPVQAWSTRSPRAGTCSRSPNRPATLVIAYSPLAQGLLSGRYDREPPPGQPASGPANPLVPAGEPRPGGRPDSRPLREGGGTRTAATPAPGSPWPGSSAGPAGWLAIPGGLQRRPAGEATWAARRHRHLTEDEEGGPCTRRPSGSARSPGPAVIPRLLRSPPSRR